MDKQIEEMAKVIEEAMSKARRTLGGHNNISKFYATMLANAGYRKIPENAVVLTREEYDNMFSFKTTRGGFYNILDTVRKVERKETAEKFAERLKKWNDDAVLGGWVEVELSVINNAIDEIAKEITEGKH